MLTETISDKVAVRFCLFGYIDRMLERRSRDEYEYVKFVLCCPVYVQAS